MLCLVDCLTLLASLFLPLASLIKHVCVCLNIQMRGGAGMARLGTGIAPVRYPQSEYLEYRVSWVRVPPEAAHFSSEK